jgi:hypothetical protein
MIIVRNVILEPDIPRAEFCCNLEQCKGGCCTLEGGRGAPLADEEREEILRALPAVVPMLTAAQRELIAAVGPAEGEPGDLATPCLNNRECVYTIFDGPIARCSFERAFLDGQITWRKPISCHLYPIRARSMGPVHLRYDRITECDAGRRKGHVEGVLLHRFLREPLVRRFGEPWYSSFAAQCEAAE